MIRVANAPCSWGVLEFESPTPHAPAAQVLDEMMAAGYVGTELGDWGFLPTEPRTLAADVGRRGLSLAGAFVPVALARPEAIDAGIERAVRLARLLAGAGAADAMIVLSDDNATVPDRRLALLQAFRVPERNRHLRAVGDKGACAEPQHDGPRNDRHRPHPRKPAMRARFRGRKVA